MGCDFCEASFIRRCKRVQIEYVWIRLPCKLTLYKSKYVQKYAHIYIYIYVSITPALLVLYNLNGVYIHIYIYTYIYILLLVVLSFSICCARARQEMDGLCFLLRFFYRKVQKSADRIYLNPVALEANLYKSKYMYRYICIYQKLFYICVCSSQHILESQQMVLGIYIYVYIIVSSTMIWYILRKS